MHVFLTGEIQVGKSTLIRRTVRAFPGLRLGGFRSVTVADIPDAMGSVYLVRAGSGIGPGWGNPEENGRAGSGTPDLRVSDTDAADGDLETSGVMAQAPADEVLNEENRIGIRYGPGKGAEGFPDVFETRGVEILRDAEQCDLILMDEIGWMEGNTTDFRERIMELLEGDVPILGVVQKRWNTPLQEHIRNHPKVRVLVVDEENRDRLVPELAAWLENR